MSKQLSPALVTAVALAAAAFPAGASAAAPAVQTGGAARVTQTSATLTGSVDPNRRPTVYFFEYGPPGQVSAARTAEFPAGGGNTPVTAAADVAGLTPATAYRYRLVARNEDGTRRGRTRGFRTLRQPLGITVAADANPIVFGTSGTLRGAVTGTGAAGRSVVLQARAFPYTTPFGDLTAPTATDATGAFVFSPLGIGATTQFRVRLADRRTVRSPVVTLGVAARIVTFVQRRVRRGQRATFRGWIRPARPGAQVGIQKRNRRGEWVVVAGTVTRGGDADRARFRKRVRIGSSGRYRVLVVVNDGTLTSNVSREFRIRATRRGG